MSGVATSAGASAGNGSLGIRKGLFSSQSIPNLLEAETINKDWCSEGVLSKKCLHLPSCFVVCWCVVALQDRGMISVGRGVVALTA